MLSDKLQKALNEQITHEMYSAYLYLAMSAHFEDANLPGMARWMRVQAGEEQAHALKFFDYINERNGRVTLQAIPSRRPTWRHAGVFEQVLARQDVTGRSPSCTVRRWKKDYAAQAMLQWFITEQVKKKNAGRDRRDLQDVGREPDGPLMLDRQLGARQIAVPITTETGSQKPGFCFYGVCLNTSSRLTSPIAWVILISRGQALVQLNIVRQRHTPSRLLRISSRSSAPWSRLSKINR